MTATSSIASDPFRDNPYRVLALPGEAAWLEIARAAERIRGLTSWGAYRTPWDLPWLLHPVRREPAHVDAALARLSNVDLRLRDRLFWFHERDAENAVAYLTPASIRDAIEGWAATTVGVTRHDAAVVALLAALALDSRVEDPSLWRRMLGEWRSAVERDEYWLAILMIEADGGFDPPASLDALNDLREGALPSVASVVIARAHAAWAGGDAAAPTRALAVLRDELPAAMVESLREELRQHAERPTEADDPGGTIDDPDLRALRRREISKHLSRLRTTGPQAPSTDTTPPRPIPLRSVDRAPAPAATVPTVESAPAPPASAPTIERATVPPVPAPPVFTAPVSSVPPDLTLAAIEREEPPSSIQPRGEAEVSPPSAAAPAPRPEVVWTQLAPRSVPRALLAVLAVAAVAAVLLVMTWSRGGEGRAPEPSDQQLVALAARLDASDDTIARLLIDRAENAREKTFVERRARDYGELVVDYEWRIANELAYDPAGYDRVRRALQEARDRHRLATERQRVLAAQYDRLVRGRQRLVSEYNDRAR
ncbi:MAG: hypothetical protein ABR527_04535 [Gemmatimonadota bacterium]